MAKHENKIIVETKISQYFNLHLSVVCMIRPALQNHNLYDSFSD